LQHLEDFEEELPLHGEKKEGCKYSPHLVHTAKLGAARIRYSKKMTRLWTLV